MPFTLENFYVVYEGMNLVLKIKKVGLKVWTNLGTFGMTRTQHTFVDMASDLDVDGPVLLFVSSNHCFAFTSRGDIVVP